MSQPLPALRVGDYVYAAEFPHTLLTIEHIQPALQGGRIVCRVGANHTFLAKPEQLRRPEQYVTSRAAVLLGAPRAQLGRSRVAVDWIVAGASALLLAAAGPFLDGCAAHAPDDHRCELTAAGRMVRGADGVVRIERSSDPAGFTCRPLVLTKDPHGSYGQSELIELTRTGAKP